MSYLNSAANVINAATPYISLASSAYGAYNTYRAGQNAVTQANIEAKAVEDSARDEEIQRKSALIRSLAAQNALAGAGGITTGGSFGAIQKKDIRDAQNDLLVSNANARAKARAIRQAGRATKSVQTTKAGLDLFGGITQFGQNYVPGALSGAVRELRT